MAPSDTPHPQTKSSLRSSLTVQLRAHSPSTLTSSTTSQVSTRPPPPTLPVVTPSRSSVSVTRTVPTTGSAPTHGALAGECKDSSRSRPAPAVLKTKSSLATPTIQRSFERSELILARGDSIIVKKRFAPIFNKNVLNIITFSSPRHSNSPLTAIRYYYSCNVILIIFIYLISDTICSLLFTSLSLLDIQVWMFTFIQLS
jgi:hypothetical protein